MPTQTLLPPSSPLSPLTIVLYENDGVALLGAVLKFEKQKYTVLNEREREIELVGERLFSFPAVIPPESRISTAEKVSFLKRCAADSHTAATKINLEEIWLFVVDEPREYSSHELCVLYYGREDLAQHLALRLALLTDKSYFKRHKDTFSPRSKETVEQLKAQQTARTAHESRLEDFVSFYGVRLQDKSAPCPAPLAALLAALEDLAAQKGDLDATRERDLKEILTRIGERYKVDLHGSLEQVAFQALEKIAHFSTNTNLALIRYRPRIDFPPELTGLSEEIRERVASLVNDRRPELREDLTTLHCVTIDDISTKDIDDGLSLEQTHDGFTVGIHISDVASVVSSNSPLDEEARARATSIYLPEFTVPMLPRTLSDAGCSLVAGELRLTMSCLVHCSHDFKVLDFRIVPGIIKVRERLTYEEVDGLLESEGGLLSTLYQIKLALETQRFTQGATKIEKHDAVPVIQADGTITLDVIDEDSPSRSLVGEFMILANNCFARFARDKKIPILFRSQERPDEVPPSDLPDGPARDWALKSKLKRSVVSTAALPHSSLGLDCYTQMTSPIRRYGDLLNQRQLLSFLQHGTPLFTEGALTLTASALEDTLTKANLLSRESKRFWLMRYLEQELERGPLELGATVTRTDLKSPLVQLDTVFLIVPLRTKERLQPGMRVRVRVNSLNARYDQVRMELVGKALTG